MLTLYYLAFFEMLPVFLVALQRVKKRKSKIRVIIVLPRCHPIIKLAFVSYSSDRQIDSLLS